MAADGRIQITQEDTIAIINAKAKQDGDSFLVKVLRKRHNGGLPEAVASFGDAQASHITSPEMWLPKIAGGGPIFVVQVYHSNEPSVQIGGPLQFAVACDGLPPKAPGEIDVRVIKSGSWLGPRQLLWPTADENKRNTDPSLYSIPTLPSAAATGNNAANNVPVAGQPGAQYSREHEANAALLSKIEQERASLIQIRQELSEEKHRSEMNEIRRESERQVKEVEARITTLIQSQNNAPKNDTSLATLISAAAPLLIKVFEGQDQMKLAMMKSQEQAQAQTQMILLKLMEKPQDNVAEKMFDKFERIIERTQASQVPQTTMLHTVMEAMSTITNSSLDLAERAADMGMNGGRPEDHPALKAIKEGVKGIGALMQGYRAQVPGAPPPPTLHSAPPALAAYPPPAAPQPNLAPAGSPMPGATVLEQLEYAIKSRVPPVEVAKVFVHAIAMGEPSVRDALRANNDDPEQLIKARMGAFFLEHPEYLPYLKDLNAEVDKQGQAAGIFDPDEQDDDDADDDVQTEAA